MSIDEISAHLLHSHSVNEISQETLVGTGTFKKNLLRRDCNTIQMELSVLEF